MFKSTFAIVLLVGCVISASSLAQSTNNCTLILSGVVTGADSNKPLFYVAVDLLQLSKGVYTDKNGGFAIKGICPGHYHLELFQIGYVKVDTLIDIESSRKIKISLSEDNVNLNQVNISSNKVEKEKVQTLDQTTLSGEQLQQTRGEVLGDALKSIAGVDVISTGPTIIKPVIHGLYSNRILILNNGVPQEGQQWGTEHAPEIDPFIATKLTVVKGAASIRYGSDAIGGVVLVDPADLPISKSLSGEINLVGMDNSRMYCGSGIIQGAIGDSSLSYRIQGTYRRSGNLTAPDYGLDNTGTLEQNYSAALAYNKQHYGIDVYYSHFYTEIGINRNTVAGNYNQLLELFAYNKPVVDSAFTYKIQRGFQTVSHDMVKISAFLKYASFGKLEATLARQDDSRQEYSFEVPYSPFGQLNNEAENDFELVTHTAELVWEHNPIGHITGSIGADFMTQENIYTGLAYAPVIPNYLNYSGGLFIIEKWSISNKLLLEGGLRYDNKWQQEYMLDATTLGTYRNTQTYTNTTATIGATYRLSPALSLDANAGNGWRSPSVYELYAYGIHGATATFEVGDSTLKVEKSYDLNTSLHYESEKLFADIGVYVNYINNYIYLQPQAGKPDATIQTIEGFFPRFNFTQTDALFKGADFDVKWRITNHLQYEPKITLVFANDLTNHDYLVLIPPERFQNSIEYRWQKLGKLKNVFIRLGNTYVAKQTRIPLNSDFVPPPNGYDLFFAAIGLSLPLGNQEMSISIQGNNLTNTAYRDYLDFFRYYADEPGRSIQLKIRIPFQVFSNKSQQTSNN
jgi:iron complex outermembrane receptor protein